MNARNIGSFGIIWPTYVLLRPHFPEGANGAVFSGMAVGLTFSALAIPLKFPIFPETVADEGRYPASSNMQKVARATIGNATFFAVFEGLRAIIRKSNQMRDLQNSMNDYRYHFSNFMAGGVAGMVFFGVTASMRKTPLELDWRLALKTVPRTWMVCGLGASLLGMYEIYAGKSIH